MHVERNHPVTPITTGATRRGLLRAVSAAFVLTAGSVLLPDFGGTEAARKKHHRNRNKRRNDRRAKRRDKRRDDPGASAWLNVALYIHNLRSSAVSVRQWKMTGVDETIRWGLMTDWLPIAEKPESGPVHFIDFNSDLKGFAVEINTGHVIEVSNPLIGFPHLEVRAGGWTDHGWDPRGETLINQGFFAGETARAAGFVAQRLNDTATHKPFLLDLV